MVNSSIGQMPQCPDGQILLGTCDAALVIGRRERAGFLTGSASGFARPAAVAQRAVR
jgi:hypothetical protein